MSLLICISFENQPVNNCLSVQNNFITQKCVLFFLLKLSGIQIHIVFQQTLIQTFRTSWRQNNFCESTAQEHKFKRWFCTQKLVLNVRSKDFCVHKNKS